MIDPTMILAVVTGLAGGLLFVVGLGWLLVARVRRRSARRAVVGIAAGCALCGVASLLILQVASRPRVKSDYEKTMDQKVESGELDLEVDLDL